MSIEKCADAVFESVQAYLSKKLQELPAPRDGKDGADGAKGLDGENGKDADPVETADLITRQVRMAVEALPVPRDGVDGLPGGKGIDGAPGADGKPGEKGLDGTNGRDGVDGAQGEKGMDGAAGRDGIDGKDGAAGQEGPPGKDGSPGRDGVDGAKGLDGAQGQPGTDGMTGLTGAKGIDGEPGRDGRDGPPGRDAAQIDILPAINEERSYARGTFASHKGGLWRAKRATEAMDGWECIVEGLADIVVTHNGERGFVVSLWRSSGVVTTKEVSLPVMVYRGVFKDGEQYERGDTTTWGGSSWHCNESTTDKPAEGGKAWTLMTKRGRDGKDGAAGAKGDKGIDGRSGRDLTQMLADGRKF